jgi:hypothetical protein
MGGEGGSGDGLALPRRARVEGGILALTERRGCDPPRAGPRSECVIGAATRLLVIASSAARRACTSHHQDARVTPAVLVHDGVACMGEDPAEIHTLAFSNSRCSAELPIDVLGGQALEER